MICSGCGAHLIDGTEKCPFCKEILSTSKNAASDMTYKIDSINEINLIKDTSRASVSLERRREKRKRKQKENVVL